MNARWRARRTHANHQDSVNAAGCGLRASTRVNRAEPGGAGRYTRLLSSRTVEAILEHSLVEVVQKHLAAATPDVQHERVDQRAALTGGSNERLQVA